MPWLHGIPGALCFICKESLDYVNHFLWECKAFRENFQSLWSNLFQKIDLVNAADGLQISNFILGLNRRHQTLLLLRGVSLPFDQTANLLVKKFLCTAVGENRPDKKNDAE